MRKHAVWVLLVAVLAAAVGCGGENHASVVPPERSSPEVAKVREAVGSLLRAKDAPDGEAVLERVLTPELFRRFVARPGALSMRPKSEMKFEVKDVEVWGKTATARASVQYADAPGARFRMTYELVETPDGWRVSGYDMKGDFGDEEVR